MSFPTLEALIAAAPPERQLGTPSFCLSHTIRAVFCDSREAAQSAQKGLFVCIVGAAFDGHRFASHIYDAGCRVFAVEHPIAELPNDALQLIYPDTRKALAALSSAFYGDPSSKLTVIGITGTKGKTTTALLAYSLLNSLGIRAGYIGTSGICFGDVFRESVNTTPESLILQKTMREMADSGVRVLLMEVSSQALMQSRVHGIHFSVALFTNLSEDHIGPTEHPDFAAYRREKRKLFTEYGVPRILLNADDPNSAEMTTEGTTATVETFSVSAPMPTLPAPTLRAENVRPSLLEGDQPGISFLLRDESSIALPAELPLPGLCNVYNALAAIAICRAIGIDPKCVVPCLREAVVPGRCELVSVDRGVRVLIDYAHNETSLREILTTLRPYARKRLIVLFGSVGGRTKNRRRPMGSVASAFADLSILTSDNPGSEPPMEILEEIKSGMDPKAPVLLIPDRKEAIEYALRIAEEGDLLLLAGKGHEEYQLVGGERLPFSEREIVSEFLKSRV